MVELFFLVEYKEGDKIKGRWLFRTSEEARSLIENDLGITFKETQDTYSGTFKNPFYKSFGYTAEIITLII